MVLRPLLDNSDDFGVRTLCRSCQRSCQALPGGDNCGSPILPRENCNESTFCLFFPQFWTLNGHRKFVGAPLNPQCVQSDAIRRCPDFLALLEAVDHGLLHHLVAELMISMILSICLSQKANIFGLDLLNGNVIFLRCVCVQFISLNFGSNLTKSW